MHIRNVIAVSAFAVALPLVPLSAQSSAPEPPKWSFSLGVDPTHFDLRTPDPGVDARMVANLTRSWQSPTSRFARHISLMMGADAPRRINPSSDPQCDYCWESISRRYAGLTAGASYDLFTASRFTPYLKGGTGIYYATFGQAPRFGVVTTSQLAWYPNGFYQNGFSVGGNAGLGIKARFGSRELFIEQMLHAFDIGRLTEGVYPFNIGIRF
jgi:hypothetical protein